MYCIFCKHENTDVVETRASEDGSTIRRRRECATCKKRFTTYERVEHIPLIVIKKDGRREKFDREKLLRGIIQPTEKTNVTHEQVETVVKEIENELKQLDSTEVESKLIGELVANHLKKINKIAYIRFASVFRRFVDVEDFEKELKKLL